jgi:D-alanyl-D-alanine dipeptidase
MKARILAMCAAVLVALSLAAPIASAAPARPPADPKAPAEFVALSDVDPTIIQEIRYFTPHNFTGDPVDGYRAPMCILTRRAADALHRAQIGFLLQGYSLKVYDCYRPQRAVNDFVAWAKRLDDQRMKAEFYVGVDKANLFRDGYIAEQSGHSRGSTVDLTLVRLPARPTKPYVRGQKLVDCTAPHPQRFPDNSIDMGTGFDCFNTLSWPLDPRIQGQQLRNRVTLLNGLAQQGFAPYEYEWWHFTFKPEAFPDTYFDFPVSRSSLRR